jgi:hypothetical protein
VDELRFLGGLGLVTDRPIGGPKYALSDEGDMYEVDEEGFIDLVTGIPRDIVVKFWLDAETDVLCQFVAGSDCQMQEFLLDGLTWDEAERVIEGVSEWAAGVRSLIIIDRLGATYDAQWWSLATDWVASRCEPPIIAGGVRTTRGLSEILTFGA